MAETIKPIPTLQADSFLDYAMRTLAMSPHDKLKSIQDTANHLYGIQAKGDASEDLIFAIAYCKMLEERMQGAFAVTVH